MKTNKKGAKKEIAIKKEKKEKFEKREENLDNSKPWIPNYKITWFPGHMLKATRMIASKLKEVDVLIEVRDARVPFSSSNPFLQQYLQSSSSQKQIKRLILFNKADLANPNLEEVKIETFFFPFFLNLSFLFFFLFLLFFILLLLYFSSSSSSSSFLFFLLFFFISLLPPPLLPLLLSSLPPLLLYFPSFSFSLFLLYYIHSFYSLCNLFF